MEFNRPGKSRLRGKGKWQAQSGPERNRATAATETMVTEIMATVTTAMVTTAATGDQYHLPGLTGRQDRCGMGGKR